MYKIILGFERKLTVYEDEIRKGEWKYFIELFRVRFDTDQVGRSNDSGIA